MNLERRALIAFVLSMAVFALFYWWYSPVLERQQQQRAETAKQQAAVRDSLAALRAPQAGSQAETAGGTFTTPMTEDEIPAPAELPVVSTGPAPMITIETSLYRVMLSTAGAEIRSVKLLDFETEGEPVELFSHAPESLTTGVLNLRLMGSGEEVSLSAIRFEPYLKGGVEPLSPGSVVVLNERKPDVELVFEAVGENGKRIAREYRFAYDSYIVESRVRFAYDAFPFVRRISWGLGPGMISTEANTEDDYTNFQASIRLGEEIHKRKPKDFSKKRTERFSGTVQWAALQTKYFTTILIPQAPTGGDIEMGGLKETHMLTSAIELPAGERGGEIAQGIQLYLGPLDFKGLKSMGLGLEKNINMGYKLLRPVSWAILWSLIAVNKFIPNMGLVIIILSVLTKVLFYRLTHKSFKSMRDMQALQPKLQAIKEKYKDDKAKISSETMKVYKEGGVNPLGGCLPLLFQMPVFIALFNVLKYTIELRGASFALWMTDLSQQDVLFTLPMTLPVIGNVFSLLPILMGGSMLLQTKIGGSITGSSGAAGQPKAMTYMLPIVFTFLFYRMPSGLVLYWLVNTVLSIAQQYYINKDVREEKKEEKREEKLEQDAAAAAEKTTPLENQKPKEKKEVKQKKSSTANRRKKKK